MTGPRTFFSSSSAAAEQRSAAELGSALCEFFDGIGAAPDLGFEVSGGLKSSANLRAARAALGEAVRLAGSRR